MALRVSSVPYLNIFHKGLSCQCWLQTGGLSSLQLLMHLVQWVQWHKHATHIGFVYLHDTTKWKLAFLLKQHPLGHLPLLLVLLNCSSKTKPGVYIYMGSLGYIMHCPPIASVLCLLHLVSITCRYEGQTCIHHSGFISILSLTCSHKDRHNLIIFVYFVSCESREFDTQTRGTDMMWWFL